MKQQLNSITLENLVVLKRTVVYCQFGTDVVESFETRFLLGLLALLGQKHGLDVGQHTALSNGDTRQELVQFFVIADGELQVTRDDSGLLVVARSISCQLENLGGEVFHDGGQVDGSAGTAAFSVVSLSEHTMDTADGELESSAAAAGLCLCLGFSSFASSRHCFENALTYFLTKIASSVVRNKRV